MSHSTLPVNICNEISHFKIIPKNATVSSTILQHRKWLKTSHVKLTKQGDLKGLKFNHAIGRSLSGELWWCAAEFGHLAIVEFLYSISSFSPHTGIMSRASGNGHLDVVKYLHSIGEKCSNDAMGYACMAGHCDVVKFLHSNGVKCPEDAVDFTCANGHLEVVKFLHSIGTFFSRRARDLAFCSPKSRAVCSFLWDVGIH